VKVFYGWRVVALAALAALMMYGIGFYSFTLFVRPLSAEFGWDRAALGGAISAFWFTAPLTLATGPLIDRFSLRTLIVVGVLIEAVALILLSAISSLWMLYVLRILMGIGKILFAVSAPVLIGVWFSRRYGLAAAFALTGWHLGGMVMAPITQALLDIAGWRRTTIVLGGALIVVVIPLALWVLRVSRPEELGLAPDGGRHRRSDRSAAIETDEQTASMPPELTVGDAVKTAGFWVVIVGTLCFYFAYASVLGHVAAFLSESGLSASAAARTMGMTAGMAVLGVLVGGASVDRWPVGRLLLVVFACLVGGLTFIVAVSFTHILALRYGFVLFFGPAIGAIDVVCFCLLRAYFGPRHFAHLYGVWYFFSLAGLLLGPFAAGVLYDIYAGYGVAFVVSYAVATVGLLLVVFLRAPASGKQLAVSTAG